MSDDSCPERWLKLLAGLGPERLERLKRYARKFRVLFLDVGKGAIKAKLDRGTGKPVFVKIRLAPLSGPAWDKALDVMAGQAGYAARILSGQMPEAIGEVFKNGGEGLFPESPGQFDSSCSCGEASDLCRHIACAHILFAGRLAEDPFLIFKFRGQTREEIAEALKSKRALLPREDLKAFPESRDSCPKIPPLDRCLDNFWLPGGSLESLAERLAREIPEEPDLVKKYGNLSIPIGGRDLAVRLSEIHDAARRAAARRLSGLSSPNARPPEG